MVVTVNDRPSCSRYPNIIDLSKIAFQELASTSAGRIQDVTLALLGKNIGSFPKKTFYEDSFANLNIQLTTAISNTYFTNDSILIR